MPQLHPANPRIPPELYSEQEVLRALRTLPPEAHVFTRLCILDPERNEEREVDFLVIHPDLGLLIIEVKGKGVEPVGDHWVRHHPDGTTQVLKETPSEQLQAQQWALFRYLKKNLAGSVPQITRVLALPALPISEDRSLGPDLPASRILTKSRLDQPFIALRAAVSGGIPWKSWIGTSESRQHNISEAKISKVIEFLTPGLMPVVPLVEVINAEGRLQDELARQVLDHLALNFSRGRFRVQGGPGSGKSLIARQTARIWASEGRRVLYLAYNKAITYATQCALDDLIQSGSVLVSTYHDFAVTLLSSTNCLPQNSDLSEFFGNDVPTALADLVVSTTFSPKERWDALVVDEAQDLEPSWILPLHRFLRNPEYDPVLLLEDPAQSIYRTTRHVLGQPWTLDLSLRQHPAIRRAVCMAYPECGWESTDVPDQDQAVRFVTSSTKSWRTDLANILNGLNEEGILPSDVMVLSPHRMQTLGIVDGETFGPWQANPIPDWWESEREGQFRFGTVHAFKGLESNVVIYLSPAYSHPVGRRLAYTAYSRARHRLIVLEQAIQKPRRPAPSALDIPIPLKSNHVQPVVNTNSYSEEQRRLLLGALTVVKHPPKTSRPWSQAPSWIQPKPRGPRDVKN